MQNWIKLYLEYQDAQAQERALAIACRALYPGPWGEKGWLHTQIGQTPLESPTCRGYALRVVRALEKGFPR